MASLLEAQLQSLCGKKIPPNKNMSDIEMYAGFSVTFHTPCNLVRFPANEPLQCVSSVANILLGSCKWSSCEASTALASLLQLAVASASTWVELQGGGPAQFFPNKLRSWKDLVSAEKGKLSGVEKYQTHLSNPSRIQLKYYSNVRNTVQWPPIWIG